MTLYLREARRCFEAEGSYRVAGAPMAQQPMAPAPPPSNATRKPDRARLSGTPVVRRLPGRSLPRSARPVTGDAPQPTGVKRLSWYRKCTSATADGKPDRLTKT
jgi:hypothetical protein